MSSLASVFRGGAPGPGRAALSLATPRIHVTSNQLLTVMLAALLTLYAFLTAGGVALGPNTWAEIVLLVLGAAAAATALIRRTGVPALPLLSIILFGALTALTAASIAWSVQPDSSWSEASRTASYMAAFGGAILLARMFPQRTAVLIGGVAIAATLLCAYALLVKVFPGALDHDDPIARVKAPFDYWNAVGLIAAIGLLACLWGGSRREAGALVRAMPAPAIALLATALLLSYSRSALLAAVIGLVAWFAFAHTRLRAVVVLAPGLAGGALLTIWALQTHPLTHDHAPLAARTGAGHAFGVLLVLVLGAVFAAALAATFAADRRPLAADARRRIGTALVVVVALVPMGALVGAATSSRGLTGEISHVWHSLTNSSQVTGDVPGRLVEFGNTRPRYWNEAIRVGQHAPLKGSGAGTFGTARTRYTNDPWLVQHAHSYAVETFADLGALGLAVNLALLIAWALAVARTLRGTAASAPERTAMLTLLCVVGAFGVSSAVDWTWFIPGAAIPALLCAGWLAGRGALAGRGPLATDASASSGRLLERPLALAALTGMAVVVLFAAWAIWQPLRSANADSAAIAAMTRGDSRAALADAEAAAARDPVSMEPLWELSAIYSALGDSRRAEDELRRATHLQPSNPDSWRQLGYYELRSHKLKAALAALHHALSLDRGSYPTIFAIRQAQSELQGAGQS